MRVLDLFCGAGGAGMGYHLAGFEVVGIDLHPQPNYPFEFIQGDVMWGWENLESFDLVHASPPCQAWAAPSAYAKTYPELVAPTRKLLEWAGLPYVIENVPRAPIRKDLLLCGSMFGLRVQRHRIFEIKGFTTPQPACDHTWPTGGPWDVTGNAGGRNNTHTKHRKYYDLAHARELMEMPWAMRTKEITEAIPPAYTRFIADSFCSVEPAA